MSKLNTENLKLLRKKKGVIQADVATYLGIGRTGYVKIENGVHDIDSHSLLMLAEYFGCSVDYLLGYNSPVERKQSIDTTYIDKAYALLEQMDTEQQKTAIRLLKALADENKQ